MYWLSFLVYAALIIFVILSVLRIAKLAMMPIHLRWELYPLWNNPKEEQGSYFEDLNSENNNKRHKIIKEYLFIIKEITLFSVYYRMNKKYWIFVYPFHLGIFLSVIWFALLLLGSLLFIAYPDQEQNVLQSIITICGSAGLILTIYGCASLIVKRATSADLKLYSAIIDYFNLSFMGIITSLFIGAWLFTDINFLNLKEIVRNILVFNNYSGPGLLYILAIIFLCVFIVYLPFTRMTHYIAKYFAYHCVRWDDNPTVHGGDKEKKVNHALTLLTTWSGPHMIKGTSWMGQAKETGLQKSKNETKN